MFFLIIELVFSPSPSLSLSPFFKFTYYLRGREQMLSVRAEREKLKQTLHWVWSLTQGSITKTLRSQSGLEPRVRSLTDSASQTSL